METGDASKMERVKRVYRGQGKWGKQRIQKGDQETEDTGERGYKKGEGDEGGGDQKTGERLEIE